MVTLIFGALAWVRVPHGAEGEDTSSSALDPARLLEQIYEASGQQDRLYVVLKLQREVVQGPERERVLGRMAQVSAEGLSDIEHSIEIYRELLGKNPRNEQAFSALEAHWAQRRRRW